MSWTDEDAAIVEQLWGEGLSASQIAGRLKRRYTRNAVIGKVHRMGLSGRAVIKRKTERSETASRPRKIRLKPAPTKPQKDILAELPVEPLPAEDIRPEKLVAFVDLEPHHCRWVYGDPKESDHGFCGSEKVIGLPYCAAHARRAYQPPSSERKKITYVHPSEKVFA